MIEVTAAIARAAPNLRSQIAAARSIGSNGRSIGFGTASTYLAAAAGPARIHPRPARHVLDTHDYDKLYSVLEMYVTETRGKEAMWSPVTPLSPSPRFCRPAW